MYNRERLVRAMCLAELSTSAARASFDAAAGMAKLGTAVLPSMSEASKNAAEACAAACLAYIKLMELEVGNEVEFAVAMTELQLLDKNGGM